MKRRHPNSLNATIATALAVCAVVAGCRNQSGGIANPFLAPNRVPAPSTRMIAPGTAQPYYPGDPLPVMQSFTQPPPAAALAGATTGPQWQSPLAPTNAAPISAAPAAAPPIALSNEPSVSIPSDGEALRFALPSPPPPQEPAPITPVTEPTPPPTILSGAQLTAPTAVVPPTSGVEPAAYNQPTNVVAPTTGIPSADATKTTPSTVPWRSPQVAKPSQPQQFVAQPYNGMPAQPISPAAAPSSMDVRLRAVPSPPPVPVEATTPRIRLPGYPTRAATGVPIQSQPNGYYTIIPTDGSSNPMQTVQITPLQSPWDGTILPTYGTQLPGDPAINVATQHQPSTLSPDGFRPRSTMR